MRHGSLFSGIGGFDLAAEWMGWDNVFHCEIEQDKRQFLELKWPKAESYGDISATDFSKWRGKIDILTGGFPCQDASIAKQDGEGQQGLQGERTGLAYEMLRAIREIRPRYIIAENVANFLKTNGGRDFTTILSELSRMGYNAEWRTCYAAEVGAPHKRKRLYIVAYSKSIGLQPGQTYFSHVAAEASPFCWRPYGAAIQISRGGAWNSEPPILCVDNGLPSKLVRRQIHGYGNAVVPQIPFAIYKAISEYEKV
jgi:DNA (cytosine-5)-methyltransferase 1